MAAVNTLPRSTKWDLTESEMRSMCAYIELGSKKMAATDLAMSEHTLQWHIRKVLRKMNVRCAMQAAVLLERNGYIKDVDVLDKSDMSV